CRAVGRRILQQELRVADDVIERGTQLVTQVGERARLGGHGPALPLRSTSIFPSSRSRSTGFVSKSSQPAAIAFSRAPDLACAVRAITGTPRAPPPAWAPR